MIIRKIRNSNTAREEINCQYLLLVGHLILTISESVHKLLDLSRNINRFGRNKIRGIDNLENEAVYPIRCTDGNTAGLNPHIILIKV